MRTKGANVFVSFLELLKVKHTKEFSNRYFNEHPHKYNLFGISKMLSDYGVENAGIRIEDKEQDLFNIELPFIAHIGSSFVVVYKVQSDKVYYLWNGKKIIIPVSDFIKTWTSIVLLAEITPDSIEPDYQEHRKKELFNISQKSMLILAGTLIFGVAYISNSLFTNLGISLLLLVNLIGVYIGYLLVLKQMHVHSQYADKICTLFSKSDCNNVLESDAAKLWGVFGWSEIGLGYFVANVLLVLFLPHTISLLALINIIALPYSFWSVWYQKTKARQWCPLCLIVQVLLWSNFIINGLFGYIWVPEFNTANLINILLVGSIYVGCVFILNLLIPNLSRGSEMEQIKQEINSIKADEAVFRTLLSQQPVYEVSKADSQILFGNLESQLIISILTNPFCNPCAKMHKRVEKLLHETNRKVCVQYLFSSFSPDLEFANKYLIAAYLEKEQKEFERIIANWFEKGKPLRESFFEDLDLNMDNPDIETEFQKHEAWKEKTQLRATPTILVNGYKLPDNYKIENLRYFTDFTPKSPKGDFGAR
ncbi:MAG: thioredoxin domain-containing protein [Candidatus Azobacteroides sp.]|nr:thioredoxin domain-containing protein [Candidatus Azobacteroides sp.]